MNVTVTGIGGPTLKAKKQQTIREKEVQLIVQTVGALNRIEALSALAYGTLRKSAPFYLHHVKSRIHGDYVTNADFNRNRSDPKYYQEDSVVQLEDISEDDVTTFSILSSTTSPSSDKDKERRTLPRHILYNSLRRSAPAYLHHIRSKLHTAFVSNRNFNRDRKASKFVMSKWKKIDLSKVRKLVNTKNKGYVSKGGEFRMRWHKLAWQAVAKVNSLENKDYKPGGGNVTIFDQPWKPKPKVSPYSEDDIDKVSPLISGRSSPYSEDLSFASRILSIKSERSTPTSELTTPNNGNPTPNSGISTDVSTPNSYRSASNSANSSPKSRQSHHSQDHNSSQNGSLSASSEHSKSEPQISSAASERHSPEPVYPGPEANSRSISNRVIFDSSKTRNQLSTSLIEFYNSRKPSPNHMKSPDQSKYSRKSSVDNKSDHSRSSSTSRTISYSDHTRRSSPNRSRSLSRNSSDHSFRNAKSSVHSRSGFNSRSSTHYRSRSVSREQEYSRSPSLNRSKSTDSRKSSRRDSEHSALNSSTHNTRTPEKSPDLTSRGSNSSEDQPKHETDSKSKPDPESVSETESELEPELEKYSDPESDQDPENDAKPEQEPELKPERDEEATDILHNISIFDNGSTDGIIERASYQFAKGPVKGKSVFTIIPEELRKEWDPDEPIAIPPFKFDLEFVYGYYHQTKDKINASQLIYLKETSEIVYYLGRVVILYKLETQSQRFYIGHTSNISSLTLHPNGILIATCQSHFKTEPSCVQVWNHLTLTQTCYISLERYYQKISTIAFSVVVDGTSHLSIVEDSDQPVILVFKNIETSTAVLFASYEYTEQVFYANYQTKQTSTFLTISQSQAILWKEKEEGCGCLSCNMCCCFSLCLSKETTGVLVNKTDIGVANLESRNNVSVTATCFALTISGEIITGNSEGILMVWKGNKISQKLEETHQGMVAVICIVEDGSFISYGKYDETIKVFDGQYKLIGKKIEDR